MGGGRPLSKPSECGVVINLYRFCASCGPTDPANIIFHFPVFFLGSEVNSWLEYENVIIFSACSHVKDGLATGCFSTESFISEVVDNPVALVSNANRGRFAKVVLKGGASL